jgi:hypothetical protein
MESKIFEIALRVIAILAMGGVIVTSYLTLAYVLCEIILK